MRHGRQFKRSLMRTGPSDLLLGCVSGSRWVDLLSDSGSLLLFRGKDEKYSAPFLEGHAVKWTGKPHTTREIVADGVFAFQEERVRLVTLNRGGTVGLWDWKAREHKATVDLETGEVEEIAVSLGGKVVAIATDKRVQCLDVATRKPVGGEAYEHPKVKRIRFANDNKHFASLGVDDELRVWALDFMEQIDPLKVAPHYDGQSF